jgi:hypothetical protein
MSGACCALVNLQQQLLPVSGVLLGIEQRGGVFVFLQSVFDLRQKGWIGDQLNGFVFVIF